MILYITLAVITICIAAKVTPAPMEAGVFAGRKMPSQQQVRNGILLLALFLILFLASALRINTGNDYYKYVSHCHDVFVGNYVVTEPGFNGLVKLTYTLAGREVPLVIFGFYAFGTVAFFLIGLYRQSKDFGISFFLFMALGLYFTSYNTVRYYFALSIVFFAMEFAKNRRWIAFVFWVLVAALFHKTAFIVIPLYALATIRLRPVHFIVLALLGASGIFLKAKYLELFIRLYPSYVHEEEYLAEGGLSVINIIRCLLVLGFCLLYYKKGIREDRELSFYFNLNIGALLLYACFSFIPFCSRIGYYLNVSQLLLLPGLLAKMKQGSVGGKISPKVWRVGLILAGVLYFALFLYKAGDETVKILPYASWLFT